MFTGPGSTSPSLLTQSGPVGCGRPLGPNRRSFESTASCRFPPSVRGGHFASWGQAVRSGLDAQEFVEGCEEPFSGESPLLDAEWADRVPWVRYPVCGAVGPRNQGVAQQARAAGWRRRIGRLQPRVQVICRSTDRSQPVCCTTLNLWIGSSTPSTVCNSQPSTKVPATQWS